jgi:hypothetical protein
MHAECPNCRHPISRARLFSHTAWGRWRCEACGALLGIDKKRRLLALIPYTAIVFGVATLLPRAGLGNFAMIPALLVVLLLFFAVVDRAVLVERTGFRCRQCGYDLQGQVEGRCPECGSEFDLGEMAKHAARPHARTPERSRAGVWALIALSLVFGGTLVLVGLAHYRFWRAGTAGGTPAVAQPTSQTASGGQPAPDRQAATAPASRSRTRAEGAPP